jgi:hypothetical protein
MQLARPTKGDDGHENKIKPFVYRASMVGNRVLGGVIYKVCSDNSEERVGVFQMTPVQEMLGVGFTQDGDNV